MVYNNTPTTHPLPAEVNLATNTLFGGIYVLCMVLGVPGNILALCYFNSDYDNRAFGSRKRLRSPNKVYFNLLFRVVCLTDIVICTSVMPNFISFFYNRQPAWFDNKVFCSGWGLLWEVLPYLSTSLVGVMSLSRLLILVSPLVTLNSIVLAGFIGVYCTYLVLRTVIPVSLNLAEYVYDRTDVFCFELNVGTDTGLYWKFNTISRLLQLAFPIFPIILSCVAIISTLLLLNRKSSTRRHSSVSSSNATVTIVLFTLLYILCNLPVTANYLLMVLALKGGCSDECYHKVYRDYSLLVWFSWNFTYVTCVAINSTVNPLLYFCRMAGFRNFLEETMWRPIVGVVDKSGSVGSASGGFRTVVQTDDTVV